MPNSPSPSSQGGAMRPLRLREFESMTAELQSLRSTCTGKSILGFVRGLRLSARLIYFLRKYLSDLGLEVDWGHLVDADENFLSRECDVIIHKRGVYDEWDEYKNPVMHFKFIECEKTLAVISCKSLLSTIDKRYCSFMSPFVKKVFLFAECCPEHSLARIKNRAALAGYAGVGYLYSLNEETGEMLKNPEVWKEFMKGIRETCEG